MLLSKLNRLLSFEDVVEKYGGPLQVWEKLRPSLPVFQVHDGRPFYLESRVDEFLHALQQFWSLQKLPAPNSPAINAREADEHLTILEASKRFLGGKKSKEWWYKQVTSKRLPAVRAGGSILLKLTDIVAFVDSLLQEEAGPAASDLPGEPPAPEPTPPPPPRPKVSNKRGGNEKRSGFRFFGQ